MVEWMQTSGLPFTGIPGQATHRDGHVIDLVFSDIPFTETSVAGDLRTGSDHETLLTTIPGRGFSAPERVRYRVPLDCIPEFYGLVKAGAQSLPSADAREVRTPVELDLRVEKLNELFDTALKTAGRPARDGGDDAPWWTEECAVAHKAYLEADRGNP